MIRQILHNATFPWCLLETDLHVATGKSGIPRNRPGNPIPGQFDYGDDYGVCQGGTVAFEIPLDEIDGGVGPGDSVAIAAYAEVEDGEREEGAWGKGARFVERSNRATYFTCEVQEPQRRCRVPLPASRGSKPLLPSWGRRIPFTWAAVSIRTAGPVACAHCTSRRLGCLTSQSRLERASVLPSLRQRPL